MVAKLRVALALLVRRLVSSRSVAEGGSASEVVEAALRRTCDVWPVRARGRGGCDGLLRAPLAQSAASAKMLRAKLAAALKRKKLTVAFMGDSITAGHDNFYNQSFVPLLVRMLGPPLQALGVELVTRNLAVGNIGEYPFTAGCMQTRLGRALTRSVDVVSWNWGMYGDSTCEKMHFVTEVADLPSKPVLVSIEDHIVPFDYLGFDKFKRDERCRLFDQPRDRGYWAAGQRAWKDSEWFLTDAFVPARDVDWVRDHCRDDAQALRPVRTKPDSLAAAVARAGLDPDSQLGANAGLGRAVLLPGTISDALLGDADATAWWAARGKAVNFLWHPGPAAHLLIAAQLATWLLDALKLVVTATAADASTLEAAAESSNADHAHRFRNHSLPAQCGRATQFCATAIAPSHGAALDALVVVKRADAALALPWHRAEDFLEADYRARWRSATPGHADGHDAKRAWMGTAASGALELAFSAQRDGATALLCENRCGLNGCERHRGWVSFGPKSGYRATFRGTTGEGEQGDTLQERHTLEMMTHGGGPPREQRGRRPRYSAEELERFRVTAGDERAFTSDVSLEVDGATVPFEHFRDMQRALEKICPACPKLRDACAVIATDLRRGAHTVKIRVTPTSFQDPDMHVAISQLMVV